MNSKIIIGVALFLFWGFAYADITKEDIYLKQMLTQLEALKPLILAAKKAAPKENRIKFHYIGFVDYKGQKHNGLLDDINEIEIGIKEKLNSNYKYSRPIEQVSGDYINTGVNDEWRRSS